MSLFGLLVWVPSFFCAAQARLGYTAAKSVVGTGRERGVGGLRMDGRKLPEKPSLGQDAASFMVPRRRSVTVRAVPA
jgi:hypothetical protein